MAYAQVAAARPLAEQEHRHSDTEEVRSGDGP